MTPDPDGIGIMAVDTSIIHHGERAHHEEKSDFAKSAEMTEPGAAWMNKKAREEYQRASMQIEDRNFSLSK